MSNRHEARGDGLESEACRQQVGPWLQQSSMRWNDMILVFGGVEHPRFDYNILRAHVGLEVVQQTTEGDVR